MTVWKGTRGNWFLGEQLDQLGACLTRSVMGQDTFIAEVLHDDEDDAEADANAKAISAVPQMVEALAEARLQLEYMAERSPSGTTPAVLARICEALKSAGVEL